MKPGTPTTVSYPIVLGLFARLLRFIRASAVAFIHSPKKTFVNAMRIALPTASKLLVCLYFANLGVQYIWYWLYLGQSFPFTAVPLIICSFAVAFSKMWGFGIVLALLAFTDASYIILLRVAEWLAGSQLYINELMMKKLSMLGCIIVVLAHDPHFRRRIDLTQKALQGLLEKEEPKFQTTQNTSIVLLIARALISGLFLFVGYGEITRQWNRTHAEVHYHGYVEGDGHNQMWLKLLQFVFAIPFVVGWKTTITAACLSCTLLAESLLYWQFWNTSLGERYATHARDHFCVNVGVAGGLYLLQYLGPGRYSVDSMLADKKRQ